MGISGEELSSRAFVQAEKFGATYRDREVRAWTLKSSLPPYTVDLDDGAWFKAAAHHRCGQRDIADSICPIFRQLEGAGVYYGATSVEAAVAATKTVAVVGGGTQQGQAAVFLRHGQARLSCWCAGRDWLTLCRDT